MAAHQKILLILGAGSNIGQAIASKFSQGGYRVALVARSRVSGDSKDGSLNIQADLSDTHAVTSAFQKTKEAFGVPNIVVYNVAHRVVTPPDDPLSASLSDLESARKIGLDSAFTAAQQALEGFRTLPSNTPTAFIYTGNALNQAFLPGSLPFSLAKTEGAMVIQHASHAYGGQGYRFYYADERKADGQIAGKDIDGPAHADQYWQLAHEPQQSNWLVTFVKGKGREEFVGLELKG